LAKHVVMMGHLKVVWRIVVDKFLETRVIEYGIQPVLSDDFLGRKKSDVKELIGYFFVERH
jgi:hypothetical protein